MDFSIPEETKMLLTTMKQFVEKECLPLERELLNKDPDWLELPPGIEEDLRNKVKAMGLWAPDVPQEYGGAGLDAVNSFLLLVERSKTTVGTPYIKVFGPMLINPLLYKASDYLKDRYLRPLARGEVIPAAVNTEPDAGSDSAAITTTAIRDGDNWIINGTKTFITNGDNAAFGYVSTVTDKSVGYKGHTMFIVDMDNPGVEVTRIIPVLRPHYTTELTFTNCVVHDRQRLSEVGRGFQAWMEGISEARLFLAGGWLGKTIRSQELAIDYVKQRSTFGQPLATRQAIQWMLVDSHIDINSLWYLSLDTAWKIDQRLDVRSETAIVKLMASEVGYRVIDRAIQCFGGLGLTKDLPLERWFRELRVARITDGSSEVMKIIIARGLLKD